MIRRLEEKDRQSIEELIKSQPTLMRHEYVISDNELKNKVDYYLKNGYMLGSVEDQLVSLLAIIPWSALPYYTLTAVYVRKGTTNFFSAKRNGVLHLVEAMIQLMEGQHRYTCYFVRSETSKWAVRRRIDKNKDLYPSLARYDYFIEEVIEPNCVSLYSSHKILLGRKTWPVRTEVIRYSLAEHFRGNDGIAEQ